jgi:hypothetical protein
MEKKRILKEDGRYLLYYHFPESATEEQTATFASIPASVQPNEAAGSPTTGSDAAASPHTSSSDEDKSRV